MKTNEFFITELKKYLETDPLHSEVNILQNAQEIYDKFDNYYVYDDMNRYIYNETILRLLQIYPRGYSKYIDIPEDIRELTEEYLNEIFDNAIDTLTTYYMEEYNNGNFDDETTVEEWNEMDEDERRDHVDGMFLGEAFNYIQMTGELLDSFGEVFEEAYAKEVIKTLKTAIKNNIEVEGNEYESDYSFNYKKEPLKTVIKAAEMTKKELIELFTEEETIQDMMNDLLEYEITEEAIAKVIGNIISKNR